MRITRSATTTVSVDGEDIVVTAARQRSVLAWLALTPGVAASVLRRHPLEEGLVADQMTALHAVGRTADALRHCGDLRLRLSDPGGYPSEPRVDAGEAAWPTVALSGPATFTEAPPGFVGALT